MKGASPSIVTCAATGRTATARNGVACGLWIVKSVSGGNDDRTARRHLDGLAADAGDGLALDAGQRFFATEAMGDASNGAPRRLRADRYLKTDFLKPGSARQTFGHNALASVKL